MVVKNKLKKQSINLDKLPKAPNISLDDLLKLG